MKKVFISLLLCTSILSTPTTKPTLITLKWESSEILSDSEGKNPININPFNTNSIWKYKLQHHYIEESSYVIRQVDEDSFEVLHVK
jgi:hypothetical protein